MALGVRRNCPKLAAVSNIWYAYNWLTRKWPWKIEEVLKQYGDVVRIAPNELVFLIPQAGKDIHATHVKHLETFVKTDFEDLGEDGGISFEIDPVKHRDVARRLSPAFSARNAKAKEAVLHKYIDLFVDKMKAMEDEEGVELRQWAHWLTMDVFADMTYNRQMNQMKNEKSSLLLNAVIKVNLFLTIQAVSKKFPLLGSLLYLFVLPSFWLTMPRVLKINSQEVHSRIERRGKTEHLDYCEQLIPRDAPAPRDQKQINYLEQIAGQLLMAGWELMSNQFYSSIFFLLNEPSAYKSLVNEIRSNNIYDGLPRMSPGAIVDSNYIPRGDICQISHFAPARSSRYFSDPLEFRPQRWLPSNHPKYNNKYQNDNLKAFLPFNQGPRMCPACAIAWTQMKLYLAKVLWAFDLEAVPGQDLSFDRDFSVYTMWNKPKIWVRFLPVKSEE
ncbi:uncharacterized protein EAF02_000752 [Botrytis sinoallii]|uniref:uncharacterized protein n=1 Tax=Botrytis sinoallii TaxID=1463999 RepID=UPI00190060CD|nr:uncharacterized protein EAF02_000752 [Botrytis sinoallii]KAF7893214.1 hypothetical protein EAF02_000752 [Botrytis sinoallii]